MPQILAPLPDGRLVRCWRITDGSIDAAATPGE